MSARRSGEFRSPGTSRAQPPRGARALLARLTPREERRYVLDDLDETFAHMARERGARAARRWYRGQLVRSLPLVAASIGTAVRDWRNSDLRSAFRVLQRRPLYALGVTGTLGLGLASAVVLGGIAWRVWLRPLPFPDAENLVRIYELGRPDPAGERDRGRISPPLLRDLRDAEWTHFDDFGAIAMTSPEWVVDGEVRPLRGSTVTPGFFELLEVAPLHGQLAWASRNGAGVPEVILAEDF